MLALAVAIVAGAFVTLFTVDLGPVAARARRASKARSSFDGRCTSARLSAKLTPGVFVVEDLVIEGLTPTDRPFLKAKKIERRGAVVDDLQPRADRRVGRDDRLGHGGRDLAVEPRISARTPQLSQVHARLEANGPEAVHDDGAERARVARQRSPTRITARRGASTASGLRVSVTRGIADRDYRGARIVHRRRSRFRSTSRFSANMQSRFTIEGSHLQFSGIDLVERRRAIEAHRRDRLCATGPSRPIRSRRRSISRRRRTSSSTVTPFSRLRPGRVPGHVSPVQGRPRAEGHVRQPDGRRECLALPEPARIRAVGAGSARSHERDERAVWRHGAVRLPAGAAQRAGRAGARDRGTSPIATSTCRSSPTSSRPRASGWADSCPGRNHLDWQLGKWGEKRGDRRIRRGAATGRDADDAGARLGGGRPVGGAAGGGRPVQSACVARLPADRRPRVVHARSGVDHARVRAGRRRRETYVEFDGRTAYGDSSRIPFHVTSLDWQESDRVLAGIMTAFGAPTGAVPIGGAGEFDGVMLMSFTKPRDRGHVHGRAHARVGHGVGTRHRQGRDREQLRGHQREPDHAPATPRSAPTAAFSLGYPRKDNGEEIDARVLITRRPLADLRHAFELDDYPVEGLVSGEYHLYGNYETPVRLRPAGHRSTAPPTARPSTRPTRRCASRARASGWTRSRSQRAPEA